MSDNKRYVNYSIEFVLRVPSPLVIIWVLGFGISSLVT